MNLFLREAKNPDELRTMASEALKALASGKPQAGHGDSSSGDQGPCRLAILSKSDSDLSKKLETFLAKGKGVDIFVNTDRLEPQKLAFQFTGQGSQYPGMGAELLKTVPAFKKAFQSLNKMFSMISGITLEEIVFNHPPTIDIRQTHWAQITIFSVECALFKMWEAAGVKPQFAIGHSIGELAAAACLGTMSFGDALKLVHARGKMMQALPAGGGMTSVFMAEAPLKALLKKHGHSIDIAAVNGAESTVLSGSLETLAQIQKVLEAHQIKSTSLHVSHGFHSELMAPMTEAFKKVASQLSYHPPQVPTISCLSGGFYPENWSPTAEYWADHIRGTVHYWPGLKTLLSQGANVFLELGPNKVLSALGPRSASDPHISWNWSMQRGVDAHHQVLRGACGLYIKGWNPNWEALGQSLSSRTPQVEASAA